MAHRSLVPILASLLDALLALGPLPGAVPACRRAKQHGAVGQAA
jgi:hypothetical protein